MTTGKIIKILRKEIYGNQEAFAKECNITQTYLSQIENDKREPHGDTLRIICDKLDIPVAVLYVLSGDLEHMSLEKRKAVEGIYNDLKQMILQLFPALKEPEVTG